MMPVNKDIFKMVKEHIKVDPSCLTKLFPRAKQKGNEIYFDAPSYNSWSYKCTLSEDLQSPLYQNANIIITNVL